MHGIDVTGRVFPITGPSRPNQNHIAFRDNNAVLRGDPLKNFSRKNRILRQNAIRPRRIQQHAPPHYRCNVLRGMHGKPAGIALHFGRRMSAM